MNSTVAWVSIGGSVLGMQAIEVNPPARAAAVPVSIVSSSSRPGSRRWTCMSIRPGETILPEASMTCSLTVGQRVVGGDAAVVDQHIGDPIHLLAGIDHAAAFDQDGTSCRT